MAHTPEHRHHVHGATQTFGRAFAIATILNVGFVAVEVVAGLLAGSVALLADAAHNLGDVAGLALAWGASALARRPPTATRTYGYGKATILAGLANAALVLVAVGGVGWEALGRLSDPPAVYSPAVIIVAGVGVLVNAGAAALFRRSRDDINARGAYVHLVADAAVSIGVVVAGIAMAITDWYWLDPVGSLAVSVVLVFWAWTLLRDSTRLAVDGVPRHIDATDVARTLAALPGVRSVHDLHIWAMSSNETAMTAHVVAPDAADSAEDLHRIHETMRERFGICHCTIQLERSRCPAPDHPTETEPGAERGR